jgi:hypothetical protein
MYMKNSEVKESFLGIALLRDTAGGGCSPAVDDEINSPGHNWKDNQNLGGLGTNGVLSMTGSINGLSTRML